MNLKLFSEPTGVLVNLLPADGIVHYHGRVYNTAQADSYLKKLLEEIAWENDQAMMFGKLIITKRKVAWYADTPLQYTYSNITKTALPWTKTLLELKKLAEQVSGEPYNSCLLNLYHNGGESMAWHSDAEPDLKKDGAIASLSFGAERKFSFKHKQTKEKIDVLMEHGSLLVMKGSCQTHWWHRLPPTKKVGIARVNLTYRTIENT